MRTPAYDRPDYEPAPAAPAGKARPVPAAGYIPGVPHQQIIPRRGLLGLWDRFEADFQKQPARNECVHCGTPTPGYSWCSEEHSDLWDDENPW